MNLQRLRVGFWVARARPGNLSPTDGTALSFRGIGGISCPGKCRHGMHRNANSTYRARLWGLAARRLPSLSGPRRRPAGRAASTVSLDPPRVPATAGHQVGCIIGKQWRDALHSFGARSAPKRICLLLARLAVSLGESISYRRSAGIGLASF